MYIVSQKESEFFMIEAEFTLSGVQTDGLVCRGLVNSKGEEYRYSCDPKTLSHTTPRVKVFLSREAAVKYAQRNPHLSNFRVVPIPQHAFDDLWAKTIYCDPETESQECAMVELRRRTIDRDEYQPVVPEQVDALLTESRAERSVLLEEGPIVPEGWKSPVRQYFEEEPPPRGGGPTLMD